MELYSLYVYFDGSNYQHFYDVEADSRLAFEDGMRSKEVFPFEMEDGVTFWINPNLVTRVWIKRQD